MVSATPSTSPIPARSVAALCAPLRKASNSSLKLSPRSDAAISTGVFTVFLLLTPDFGTRLLVGGLALTVPWGIRNSLIPSGPSSSQGRALENLVQGSWPSFQDAYAAAMKHNPTGEFILHMVEEETTLLQNDRVAGLERIGRRMRHDPWQYVRWYLGKPALFWGWNIRIGQGDIYVYPTRHSPFESNALYEVAKAVSRVLNPASRQWRSPHCLPRRSTARCRQSHGTRSRFVAWRSCWPCSWSIALAGGSRASGRPPRTNPCPEGRRPVRTPVSRRDTNL